MKNNKHLFLGTLIMGMAFASVLTGCATPGGGETPSVPDQQAEQLAADINAIRAESAVVEGAKVTLSSEVDITTGLIVPAGVTLNLTTDGAKLVLKNGAALTVDGTVDAKAEGINIDSAAANPAVINGSGTIRLKSKGRLLGIWEGKKLTLDGVTLVGLEDNNATLVEVGDGGEVFLKSGKITGNKIVVEGGTPSGGVSVFEQGIFTMTGGEISGNNAQEVGGIAISRGTFTMKGGAIFGNTGLYNGGVSIDGDATFIMEGGTIFGNTARDFGGVGLFGGSFTLKGGRIQGNTDSDGFIRNTGNKAAALVIMDQNGATAKWGTDGTYTKGGVAQTGDSDIGDSDDTLIATPAP